MSNDLKTKRDVLIQEAILREPRIKNGKKITLIMCILFVSMRVIFSIVETVYVLNSGQTIRVCVMNYILLGVAALFAFSIYKQGTKALAYLPLLGGIMSISNLFQNNLISNLQAGDAFYNFYAFIFIAAMLTQIISMLLITLNRDCKKYFDEIANINRTMTGKEYKN